MASPPHNSIGGRVVFRSFFSFIHGLGEYGMGAWHGMALFCIGGYCTMMRL